MSLGVLTHEAVRVFRDSEDGLTLGELGARIGTRWPERVYRALVGEGFVFGKQGDRLFLAGEPAVERAGSSPDLPPGARSSFVAPAASSLDGGVEGDSGDGSPDGGGRLGPRSSPAEAGRPAVALNSERLFDMEPEHVGHYDREAA